MQEASLAMASLKGLKLERRSRRTILLQLVDALGRRRVKELMSRATPAKVDVKRSDAYELLKWLDRSEGKPRSRT